MRTKQQYNQFQAFEVKKSESEIQSEIIQFLMDSGFLVVRVNSFARSVGPRFIRSYLIQGFEHLSKGFPDILALRGSSALIVECKSKSGSLKPEQKDFRDFAAQYKVKVLTARKVDDVRAYLENTPFDSS